jgi:hypothetical protein
MSKRIRYQNQGALLEWRSYQQFGAKEFEGRAPRSDWFAFEVAGANAVPQELWLRRSSSSSTGVSGGVLLCIGAARLDVEFQTYPGSLLLLTG